MLQALSFFDLWMDKVFLSVLKQRLISLSPYLNLSAKRSLALNLHVHVWYGAFICYLENDAIYAKVALYHQLYHRAPMAAHHDRLQPH